MSQVSVPVLKPLTYQGRSYVRGEILTLEAVEAAALARRGEVTLTRGAKVMPSERRDMVAELPTRRARPRAATPKRRPLRKHTYQTKQLETAASDE